MTKNTDQAEFFNHYKIGMEKQFTTTDILTQLNVIKERAIEILSQATPESYTFLALDTRKKRAISLQRILSNLELRATQNGQMEISQFKEVKKIIKQIKLENWSKQAKEYPIIKASKTKQEVYENTDPYSEIPFLEPRDYMGISKDQNFDLDDLSLVTALTPPGYTQPWHYHTDSYEVNFYEGQSQALYKKDGNEVQLNMQLGDYAFIHPNTNHTIRNTSLLPIRNCSVKVPNALKDRGEDENYRVDGIGDKLSMINMGGGISEINFSQKSNEIPYITRLYRIDKTTITIRSNNDSILYVLKGGFESYIANKTDVLSQSDVIILDSDNPEIIIKNLTGDGLIYQIEKA